jgi:hypothetical protein
MFIRAKDGFYAGEVREYPSHIAIALIAQGRAENPYAEAAPQRVEVVPPVSAKSGSKKKARA